MTVPPSTTACSTAPRRRPQAKYRNGKTSNGRGTPANSGRPGRNKKQQRVAHMISKYAGSHWGEALRCKWVVEMVTAIDGEYHQLIEDQTNKIGALEEELARLCETLRKKEEGVKRQGEELQSELQNANFEMTEAKQRALAAETKMRAMTEALQKSETAAAAATGECVKLKDAVLLATETGSKVRQELSTRAHLLREHLLQTKCDLRQQRKSQRLQSLDMGRAQVSHHRLTEEKDTAYDNLRTQKEKMSRKVLQLSVELNAARNEADHAAKMMGKCCPSKAGAAGKKETVPTVPPDGEAFEFCGPVL